MMELIIGGSGSGKSAYAEERICQLSGQSSEQSSGQSGKERKRLYYIAAMMHGGKETEEKIEKHRRARAGKGFVTREWPFGLKERLAEEKKEDWEQASVLLECTSNLLANEMYAKGGAEDAGKCPVESVAEGILALKPACRNLVVVTNDVFAESVPDSEEMRQYKKNLGEINRILAEAADQVTEVTDGIPCVLKEKRTNSTGAEGSGLHVITGGAFQGKLAYAKGLYPGQVWTDGAECDLERPETWQSVYSLQILVRRWLQAGKSRQELEESLLQNASGKVLIWDEIGCGLVPVDAFERRYREEAGRLFTSLAGRAETADRIVCGIGQRIKGKK